MPKRQNDYYELMEQLIACSVQAANLLMEIMKNYSEHHISHYRESMHKIENAADELQHDTLKKLSSEFITPIDQEDIMCLIQIIDDVTDAIDEVVIDLYMFNINKIPQDAPQLTFIMNDCVGMLQNAIGELKHFKKPEKLKKILIEVNDIEAKADEVYIEAIRKLFSSSYATNEIIGIKSIYDSLENCCDLCERASDIIEQIIMKNT